jgi:predicted DNA binding CopG/RHH family protein
MKKGSTHKNSKRIPTFRNEDKEREFWSSSDSADFLDWDKAEVAAFSDLKPTTRAISLRIPETMLEQIRRIANERDVPYQSLIKMFLKDRINQELKRS